MSNTAQAPDLRRSRAAVFVAFFIQGALFATILTRLPAFEEERGIGEGTVTALLLVTSVLAGVGSVLAEQIAVRRSSALALRVALLTIAVLAPVAGFAPAGVAMFAAFSVYGVGVGAVDASMNMQGVTVQRLYGRSVMTAFHGSWSIGAIVGALYASLTAHLDVRVGPSMLIAGGVALAATLVAQTWFVGSRTEHLVTEESEAERSEADAGQATPRGARMPWRPVIALGLVIVVFYMADTGVASWGTLYLEKGLGALASVAALGYAAYQVGAVVSRIAGDRFVVRFGAVRVVQAGVVIGVVGLLGIVAAPTAWFAIVAFFVMGLGLPVVVPLAFAAAGSIPGTDADVAIARLNIFNYLGTILSAVLLGGFATAGMWRLVFVVPLVLVPLILLVARRFAQGDEIVRAARTPV